MVECVCDGVYCWLSCLRMSCLFFTLTGDFQRPGAPAGGGVANVNSWDIFSAQSFRCRWSQPIFSKEQTWPSESLVMRHRLRGRSGLRALPEVIPPQQVRHEMCNALLEPAEFRIRQTLIASRLLRRVARCCATLKFDAANRHDLTIPWRSRAPFRLHNTSTGTNILPLFFILLT